MKCMSKPRKHIGYHGEQVALDRYTQKGYTLQARNFTIRGGEIDLIFTHETVRIFVEVKVVNGLEEVDNILTYHKRRALYRSIQTYRYQHQVWNNWRLDLVLVQGNKVAHIFPHVALWE